MNMLKTATLQDIFLLIRILLNSRSWVSCAWPWCQRITGVDPDGSAS